MGPQKEKNLGALFTLVVLGLEMQGILRQNCCIMNKIAAKHVVSLPVRKENVTVSKIAATNEAN